MMTDKPSPDSSPSPTSPDAPDADETDNAPATRSDESIPDEPDLPANGTPAAAQQAPRSGATAGPSSDADAARSPAADADAQPKINVRDLHFWYGDTHALKGITMQVRPNTVTALIGPSGCGKSTLIRCFNRMNELIQGTSLEGTVRIDGQDIYAAETDPVMVRRRVGMVFQKPNPFPKTIYNNVAWGANVNGYTGDMDDLVERSLRQAALWDEVKDRLHTNAYDLSGGQQQRLCIARTLAVEPDVVLMDEPASALDPIATAKVEETITELKKDYTIVIVTHNMQQASRISDETAFLYMGALVEMNPTEQLFTRPEKDRTEAYVTGRFG
jgi:phosphate transport system ATP-binding protein